MGSFRVVSEGPLTRPLAGTVYVGGAKNSALKLMAAALLARWAHPWCTTSRTSSTSRVMGQLLRQLGCTVDIVYPTEADPTWLHRGPGHDRRARRSSDHEAPYELVRRLRASIARARPAASPAVARPASPCPAATRSGPAVWTCTSRGLQELGAEVRIEHGLGRRRGARQACVGANLWLDFPSRRGHREPGDGRRARQGHHRRSTTSPGSRRSSTCVRCSTAMGARIDGAGHLHPGDRGRRGRCDPVEHAHGHRTGSSPAPGSFAAAIAGGDADRSRAAVATPPRHRARQARRGGCRRSSSTETRLHGRATERRLTSFDVVDAAVPRLPHRPAAVRDGAGVGRRRHRDDHRERVRGAVHVRPGARPARC